MKNKTEHNTEYLPGFSSLKPGTELGGRYTIGKILGSGGFGIVYLAQDMREQQSVAIKEYFPYGMAVRGENGLLVETLAYAQGENFETGKKRFAEEAELLMTVECDGIPKIYDCFSENNTAYYVMEYINGVDMKSYVEKNGKLSAGQAVHMMKILAETLRCMHDCYVVHRDVSPENIMFCGDGRIKLLDFSAARNFYNNDGNDMTVILKHGYAPPEQYRRKSAVSSYTDIYSLGASAFFALSGTVPDDSFSRQDNDKQFLDVSETFPEPLVRIVRKAAALDVEERYYNAENLLRDLNVCGIVPEEISAGNIVPVTEKVRSFSPKKLAIVAAAAVLICVTAVGAQTVFTHGDSVSQIASEIPEELRIGDEYFDINSEELTIVGKELTNSQISKLQHFKNLKEINLSDNYITDLSVLEGLTQLEEVHFSNNNVQDIGFLSNMKNLRKVTANNNSISDISPLEGKSQLEQLWINDNFITDISPLSDCVNLREAGFDEAAIGNIDALAGKPYLEKISITGCGITDITPLGTCPKLKYIYLGRNNITDFAPLKNCEGITEIILDNNNINGITVQTLYGINLVGDMYIDSNPLTEGEINKLSNNIEGGMIYY